MTADDGSNIAGQALWFQLFDVVQHVNRNRGNANNLHFRNAARPCAVVVIPTDGNNRSYSLQAIENFRIADIAGMQDKLNTFESLED